MKKSLLLFIISSGILLVQQSIASPSYYWRFKSSLDASEVQMLSAAEDLKNKNADPSQFTARHLVGVYRMLNVPNDQLQSYGIEQRNIENYAMDPRFMEYSKDLAVVEEEGSLAIVPVRRGQEYREIGVGNETFVDVLSGLNSNQLLYVDHDLEMNKDVLGDCVSTPYRVIEAGTAEGTQVALSFCSKGKIMRKEFTFKRADGEVLNFTSSQIRSYSIFWTKIK